MDRYIYRIEVDTYKQYSPHKEEKRDEYYESRLLCRKADDADAPWEVCNIVKSNSPESAFIGNNHFRLKLEGKW